MSVTIKMDRVDDRLCRLLGLGSLSSSSASCTCSLLGSQAHHAVLVLGALAAAGLLGSRTHYAVPSLLQGHEPRTTVRVPDDQLHRRLGEP